MAVKRYEPKAIEPKWQQIWEEKRAFEAQDFSDKPKTYISPMFPYPSGAGMHTGHTFEHAIVDAIARFYRANGHTVLNPMGWDSFGLPAENYAIKTGTPPQETTKTNIANFKNQLKRLGASIDWTREINTSDPEYYRWTQWIFTKFFERGLAYQKESLQWWCEIDQTVLANEQVVNGKCWRHDGPDDPLAVKKSIKQWFFKITDYADALLEEIPALDWPEKIKTAQTNWIGRSQGAEIDFTVESGKTNYVLLHGYSGGPNQVFLPWLKNELEQRGHTVTVPALPDPNDPDVEEQTTYVLSNCSFDENTVVIGHSLGVVVGLKVLEKLNRPIKKFVSVAGFAEPKFKDVQRPFEERTNWNFDFEQIKKIAKDIVLLRAENDSAVPAERSGSLLASLGGKLVDFTAEDDHVCGEKEPVVLQHALEPVTVFTTRPDTIFGATFLVLAPEHPLVKTITTDDQKQAVDAYVTDAVKKSEIDRMNDTKEKTGVFTGAYATNPATGEKIPVWVADYVLYGYGTGAIMAVPAHDERDRAFAEKFDLPIQTVVDENNTLMNSDKFDGQAVDAARESIVAWLERRGAGNTKVTYKMRDWLISRQRYWGAPIPIIHCDEHGAVAVPEDQLPVRLPEVDDFAPKGDGKSALARVSEWVNTTCPTCGKPALRETDTMDGYACSSWYLLRYTDPTNDTQAWKPELANYWSPVDFYVGGDHAVAHLLYVRFWTHVFKDMGLTDFKEPVKKLVYHGLIAAEDGRKMSKSLGNTVDPLEIIDQGYGADALRTFELFLGPIDENSNWSSTGIAGVYRFINRVWTLVQEFDESDKTCSGHDTEVLRLRHKTTRKVTDDIRRLSFNTAIAALMEYVNDLYKLKVDGFSDTAWRDALGVLVQLVSPFAPHVAEELWQQLGREGLVQETMWPDWDDALIVEDVMTIIVQVNGKLRAKLELAKDTAQEEIEQQALANDHVQTFVEGKEPKKVIYVPGKLVNIVI